MKLALNLENRSPLAFNLYFPKPYIRVPMFFQQVSQLWITPCRCGCLHIDRHCGADTILESTPRSKTCQKKRRPGNLQEITIIGHHCQEICISQSQHDIIIFYNNKCDKLDSHLVNMAAWALVEVASPASIYVGAFRQILRARVTTESDRRRDVLD